MRILEVRFRNLNSLAGQWKVDFTAPEFEREGIFLITGPTGAGKTTLLDAISLALYGKTPRLERGQNEIMTRHTKECWAEVDFETGDGAFRARWQQKRRPNGDFYPPARSLARIPDGKILAEKTRDAEREIQRLTGLDFSQFTRAVMLAQGAFTAFLKGGEDQKSAILEKLTDTSIYSELSILAHNREKEENAKIAAIQKAVDDLEVLDAEAEKEKNAALALLKRESDEAGEALALNARLASWRQNLAKLEKEAAILERRKLAHLARREAFAPNLAALAAAKTAREFEPQFERIGAINRQIDEIRANLKTFETQKRDFSAKVGELSRLAGQALTAVAEAENRLEKARPDLEKARKLDADIKARGDELSEAETARKSAEAGAEKNARTLNEKNAAAEKLSKSLADVANWLEQNSRDAWLEQNASALKEKLKHRASQWEEVGAREKKADETQKRLGKIDASLEKEKRALENLLQDEKECQAALADLEARRTEQLGGWTLDGLREALEAHRQALIAAEAVKNMEDRRADLEDGKPCPLCGSLDHPYALNRPPDPSLLEIRLREREKQIRAVEALAREAEDKIREIGKIGAGVEAARERVRGLGQTREVLAENYKTDAREAANLKKAALEADAEIRVDLERLDLANAARPEREIEQRLAAWSARTNEKARLDSQTGPLAAEIATLAANSENLKKAALEKAAREKLLAGRLSALTDERGRLFAGRDADMEEKNLKTGLESARRKLEQTQKAREEAESQLNGAAGSAAALAGQLDKLLPEQEQAATAFLASLAAKGWDETSFAAARKSAAEIEKLEAAAAELEKDGNTLEGLIRDNTEKLAREADLALTDKTAEALAAEAEELGKLSKTIGARIGALAFELQKNAEKAGEKMALERELRVQKKEYEKWSELDRLIGSADGKKFRAFAQNITLDQLLERANIQLAKIMPRYAFTRVGKAGGRESFLDIAVEDNYQAGEIRAIENLSGGESFIASLALALGLSDMAAANSSLGSLFLDEGFGSLDPETLRTAIDAIAGLRGDGKLIGIISHVEALKERIPTQIAVNPQTMGRSEIAGPGCARL